MTSNGFKKNSIANQYVPIPASAGLPMHPNNPFGEKNSAGDWSVQSLSNSNNCGNFNFHNIKSSSGHRVLIPSNSKTSKKQL
jgi:hypothetical protein